MVSQLIVTLLWGITPMAGLIGLTFGLEAAAGRQRVTPDSSTRRR